MKNILLRSRLLLLAFGLLLAAPALWSCNTQTALQKQVADHDSQLRIIDEDTIQRYLQRNSLINSSARTNSGLYVVNITSGQGAPVATGKQVRIKYIGRFLSNGAHPASTGYAASYGNPAFPAGSIFDNTADNHTTCGCVVVTAGSEGRGAGFTEGLLLMHQGDRKLLLVPSRLAYGPNGSSPTVPPDSALSYDVEILDVF